MPTQKFSNFGPIQSSGSIFVLQALVAQLIARHPDRDRIIKSVSEMSNGIKATPNKTDIAAQQIHDFAQGMDDTVASIREYLTDIDINADAGFRTSAD
jgi:ABC-type transporter Mla subunit MlaD